MRPFVLRAVAAVVNCNCNRLAVQSYRGLTAGEREKNGETEVEHVAGITGPRRRCKADYKGVKSIKITMLLVTLCSWRHSRSPQMRQASGKGTKDEEVECDAK